MFADFAHRIGWNVNGRWTSSARRLFGHIVFVSNGPFSFVHGLISHSIGQTTIFHINTHTNWPVHWIETNFRGGSRSPFNAGTFVRNKSIALRRPNAYAMHNWMFWWWPVHARWTPRTPMRFASIPFKGIAYFELLRRWSACMYGVRYYTVCKKIEANTVITSALCRRWSCWCSCVLILAVVCLYVNISPIPIARCLDEILRQ